MTQYSAMDPFLVKRWLCQCQWALPWLTKPWTWLAHSSIHTIMHRYVKSSLANNCSIHVCILKYILCFIELNVNYNFSFISHAIIQLCGIILNFTTKYIFDFLFINLFCRFYSVSSCACWSGSERARLRTEYGARCRNTKHCVTNRHNILTRFYAKCPSSTLR